MEIVTDSSEIHAARKMALELLISDHYADCEAPCMLACPGRVDVQTYVSLIANGQYHEAVKVIKETLPMPLSIGRVCPAFCEKSVAEPSWKTHRHPSAKTLCCRYGFGRCVELSPEKKEATGNKIAIIGAGLPDSLVVITSAIWVVRSRCLKPLPLEAGCATAFPNTGSPKTSWMPRSSSCAPTACR